MRRLHRCTLALLLAAPVVARALPSDIDTSWAVSGSYTLNDRTITATAMTPSGKLLLAGTTTTGIYVQRLTVNGTLDTTFASNGTLDIPLATRASRDRPVLLVALADGAFYLAENPEPASAGAATPDFVLQRFTSAGVPDTGFGSSGSMSGHGKIHDISLDAAGRIYVYADVHDPVSGDSWSLARYLPTATLDTSYGSSGYVTGSGLSDGMIQLSNERLSISYDSQDAAEIVTHTDLKHVIINTDGGLGVIHSGTPILGAAVDVEPYGVMHVPFPVPNGNDTDALFYASSQHAGFTDSNGIQYTNLRAISPHVVAVYPDGFVLFLFSALFEKITLSGNLDSTWKNAANPLPHRVGVSVTVASDGGLLIGQNNESYNPATDNGVLQYAAPASIVRLKGSAPDTAPGAIATPQLQSDGTYYRTSAAITVSRLGAGNFVPARLSFGELSTDGGTTWLHGWAWVQNGSNLLVRYPVADPAHPAQPVTATLTVGGYFSPNNPSLPLGDVLTVSFSNATANVTQSLASASDHDAPPASSGGGSTDIFTLLVLLWPAVLRRGLRTGS